MGNSQVDPGNLWRELFTPPASSSKDGAAESDSLLRSRRLAHRNMQSFPALLVQCSVTRSLCTFSCMYWVCAHRINTCAFVCLLACAFVCMFVRMYQSPFFPSRIHHPPNTRPTLVSVYLPDNNSVLRLKTAVPQAFATGWPVAPNVKISETAKKHKILAMIPAVSCTSLATPSYSQSSEQV